MEHEAASGFIVDWRLLLIQAVNFLILLGLLTWILWKPLVRMMDERRKTIAEGLAAAKLSREALAQAEAERQELLATAKAEANRLITDTRAQLKAERADLAEEFRHKKQELKEQVVKERAELVAQAHTQARKELGQLVVTAVTKVARSHDFSDQHIKETAATVAKDRS